jgi:hypothetical protein
MLKLRLDSVPVRTSKKKIVFFVMDHKRRELALSAGTTKLAALTEYLTNHYHISGDALKEEQAKVDDLDWFDIQPATMLVTKAKHKPQRLVGW